MLMTTARSYDDWVTSNSTSAEVVDREPKNRFFRGKSGRFLTALVHKRVDIVTSDYAALRWDTRSTINPLRSHS